ncbi:MAG: nucleotidyltransferase domain-containing protein [Rhodocyclaceae bacterium]|nr:nucleotidyltransferase domain-containing protein [Rhodocyclaceae bacterium]
MNLPASLADALFGKTRKAAIGLLFSHPEQSWHLRELARRAAVSPTMLGKEMASLAAAGIVLDERDGNRRRFRANPDCPIFPELCGIARKTAGVADVLRDALLPLAGIDCAFIFGSVARGEAQAASDVDLCVLGDIAYNVLLAALATAEAAVGRPINPMLYTRAEFRQKRTDENPFVCRMLAAEKIFLIGNPHELE